MPETDPIVYQRTFRASDREVSKYSSEEIKDILTDPTLPRVHVVCGKCGYDEAVQVKERGIGGEVGGGRELVVLYVCRGLNCANVWSSEEKQSR